MFVKKKRLSLKIFLKISFKIKNSFKPKKSVISIIELF